MLNESTIHIIKSTVPVLEQHGLSITKCFYNRLFTNHPELLNVFNHANQQQERQQMALAQAVLAAAKHIDQLAAIVPVVQQIAHKHRSLGVKKEHYPIVGHHLLAAIQEVLGDAATEEIIQAWAEAYGVIADIFISVEAELYDHAENQTGGWEDFRAFVVKRKEQESDLLASFYLVPQDGGQLSSFEPGQYVSVKVQMPNDPYTHIRQYSLSDSPDEPYYRITVKREEANGDRPAGKVSCYLHEYVQEGDVLHLSAPAGEFTLQHEDQRPVVWISGGVGITPMISMLKAYNEEAHGPTATFIHAAADGNAHAFRDEVAAWSEQHAESKTYLCYTRPTAEDQSEQRYQLEGRIDAAWLKTVLPTTDARFYICGSSSFMETIIHALGSLGVNDADIHYEYFGPKGSLKL